MNEIKQQIGPLLKYFEGLKLHIRLKSQCATARENGSKLNAGKRVFLLSEPS